MHPLASDARHMSIKQVACDARWIFSVLTLYMVVPTPIMEVHLQYQSCQQDASTANKARRPAQAAAVLLIDHAAHCNKHNWQYYANAIRRHACNLMLLTNYLKHLAYPEGLPCSCQQLSCRYYKTALQSIWLSC